MHDTTILPFTIASNPTILAIGSQYTKNGQTVSFVTFHGSDVHAVLSKLDGSFEHLYDVTPEQINTITSKMHKRNHQLMRNQMIALIHDSKLGAVIENGVSYTLPSGETVTAKDTHILRYDKQSPYTNVDVWDKNGESFTAYAMKLKPLFQ